jgi:5-methylcytosine-specific restriction enzyme A
MLALLCDAPDNELSAGELARHLGIDHHVILNSEAAHLAKQLIDASGVEPPRREDGSIRWWVVPFSGRCSSREPGRRFLWRLRPEIRDALIECGFIAERILRLYPESATPSLVEGGTKTVLVNSYERNSVARNRCIGHYGAACTVCHLNFAERYGPVAEQNSLSIPQKTSSMPVSGVPSGL